MRTTITERLKRLGAQRIAAERVRQRGERRGDADDDECEDGELVDAAACYSELALEQLRCEGDAGVVDFSPLLRWPWEADRWDPSPRADVNLAKAGALLAAEIDRMTRAAGG